jgi:hypothetical protein
MATNAVSFQGKSSAPRQEKLIIQDFELQQKPSS